MKNERDENEFKIINKILTASVIIIVAVCLFLIIANIVISILMNFEKIIINFDYFAIIFLYLSFVCFFSHSKSKNIYHLIIGVGFCLTFFCMLVLHFVNLIA